MQVNDCLFNSQLFFAVRNGTLRNLNLNPPKDSKLVPDQAMTDGSQYMFGTGERLHEARTLCMWYAIYRLFPIRVSGHLLLIDNINYNTCLRTIYFTLNK